MPGHAAAAVKAPPPTLEQAHAPALQATIIQGLTPSPSVAKPGTPPAPSPLKAPPPTLEQARARALQATIMKRSSVHIAASKRTCSSEMIKF